MLRAYGNTAGVVRKSGRGAGNGASGVREVLQTWDPATKGTSVTLSGGNLTADVTSNNNWVFSTGSKSSGKWYFELVVTAATSGSFLDIGVGPTSLGGNSASSPAPNSALQQFGSGGWTEGGTPVVGSAYALNDVIGFAVDFTTNRVTAYKNNVANGNAAFSGNQRISVTQRWGGGTFVVDVRTTTAQFTYSPPSGFSSWGST